MAEEKDKEDDMDPVTSAVIKEVVPKLVEKGYDDLRPVVQEVTKAVAVPLRLVNLVLGPLRTALIAGESFQERVESGLKDRLKDVPEEHIQPPPTYIAGPALQGLAFVQDEEDLSSMFLNILASSMNKETSAGAHPSFVELLRQLSPGEARLLNGFFQPNKPVWYVAVTNMAAADGRQYTLGVGNAYALLESDSGLDNLSVTVALENLKRLGLTIEEDFFDAHLGGETIAATVVEWADQQLDPSARFNEWLGVNPPLEQAIAGNRSIAQSPAFSFSVVGRCLSLTQLGRRFCAACISSQIPEGYLDMFDEKTKLPRRYKELFQSLGVTPQS